MSGLPWNDEEVRGWGNAVRVPARVARPTTGAELESALAEARAAREPLALRGSGCSYGDAALLARGRVLDLSRMNRILAFDPATGIARVEPGVTIRDLWRHTIPHGYWPAVVPGTMFVSLGGAAAMNIHGKNNFVAGPFGEHVKEFELLLPDGRRVRCDRERESELFHAAIGGFGMLGCFTELTVKLKKVHSGRMKVRALVNRDLDHALELFDRDCAGSDYYVGWLDAHATGSGLGRGVLHRADHYEAGEDPEGERMLAAARQDVPKTVLGVIPKSWMWPGLWTVVNGGGMPFLNAGKFWAGGREEKKGVYPQTHGAFHFLLDYIPNYKNAFLPGGLIQFQPFVPKAAASRVLRKALEMSQAARIVPYLLVLKRHRPDPFLMTHAVDGFSLAMEYQVSDKNRARLWELCARMAELVLEAGGRFYYAKDATLTAPALPRIHGDSAVARFRALKARVDPAGLLQTDLARRLGVLEVARSGGSPVPTGAVSSSSLS